MCFDWNVFACNYVMTTNAAFLCVFTVHDRLKAPLWRVATLIAAMVGADSTLTALLPEGHYGNLLIPVFLATFFYAYQRFVGVPRGKLLFIFFAVASYICFAIVLNFIVDDLMSDMPLFQQVPPSQVSVGEMYTTLFAHILSTIPAGYVLRRKIWPLIRDLEMPEWSSLWVIPMINTLVIVAFTEHMHDSPMSFWLYIVGMMMLGVGAFVSYYLILRMMHKSAEAARTREQARMMELQLHQQRQQYESLSDGIDMARKARHDLRHTLAALRGYAAMGDLSGLGEYLDQLIVALPQSDESILCKNYAINAVARHYVSLARSQDTQVNMRLDIPETLPHALELDLCVLIGNMLENAAEACARMETNRVRRIDAVAVQDGTRLTFAVSNTFDGGVTTQGGAYHSRKHTGEGIGINSIRAIAQKYDGYSSFAHNGSTFEAAAVINGSTRP